MRSGCARVVFKNKIETELWGATRTTMPDWEGLPKLEKVLFLKQLISLSCFKFVIFECVRWAGGPRAGSNSDKIPWDPAKGRRDSFLFHICKYSQQSFTIRFCQAHVVVFKPLSIPQ
jgi:hypothetical protein